MSLPHALDNEQIVFVRQCVRRWLELGADYNSQMDGRPTPADADHSALLYRLLAGQKVFDKAPPRAFSYPWYELVEKGSYVGTCSVNVYQDGLDWFMDGAPVVVLNQAPWKIISCAGKRYEIEWPPTGLRATLTIGPAVSGEFKEVVIEVHDAA